MKKYFQTAIIFVALGVIFGFASTTGAQIKTGGYKTASKTSAEVRAAANFAVKARSAKDRTTYRLAAIEKAETQVVAGTNYRLCLFVSTVDKEAGVEIETSAFYQVVVFRNLKREFSLKSWAEADCNVK
jgi:hypothetical protein